MMDVSDGLLLDSWRMAQASGVTFALETDAIPVADPTRRDACIRWGTITSCSSPPRPLPACQSQCTASAPSSHAQTHR